MNNKVRNLSVLIPLICNPVSAVEMGPLKLGSQLNQPFRAVMDLSDVDALELSDIRFSLADRAAYRRFNLQRPADLKTVKFKVTALDSGHYELHISSKQRVVEPILNILIQVREKQGSFFRHYTLLLDPPGTVSASAGPAIANALASAKPVTNARPEIVDDEEPAVGHSQTLLVKNDSISIIAQNSTLHEKYSVYQIMRAFYLANSWAFEKGNIDRLISGSRLIIPEEEVIAEVPRRKAINFVRSVSTDHPKVNIALRPGRIVQPAVKAEVKKSPPVAVKANRVAPVEKPQVEQAENADTFTLKQDVKAWRGMATEFDSLNSIVEKQNQALLSHNDAVKSLALDVENHESQILKLALKINHLQSLLPGVSMQEANAAVKEQQVLMENQQQLIRRQEKQLQSVNEQLEDKDAKIHHLNQQIQSVNDQARSAQAVPAGEIRSSTVPPVPEAEVSAPQIVTYPQNKSDTVIRWGLTLLLLASLFALALREWTWRRRFGVKKEPVKNTVKKPQKAKASTRVKPAQMGTVELKHIDSKDKAKPSVNPATMNTTDKSELRLESTTADAAQIEIEVLLAYEQYGDAMQLLQLCQKKFGEADWVDLKTLEILAATNQCEEFLALFNEKRASLEAGAPIAWAKIEKLRNKLCEDFNISALG